MVPLDPDASGIPAAVLRYRVTNPQQVPVATTVVGSVSHTAGRGDGAFGMRAQQTVRWREDDDVRGLDFGIRLPEDDLGYGTLSLTTADASITAKPQWVTGFWPDGARLFWNDLSGRRAARTRAATLTPEDRPRGLFADSATDGPMSEEELFEKLPRLRTGSLGIVHPARSPRRPATSSSCSPELPESAPRPGPGTSCRTTGRGTVSCETTTPPCGRTPGRPRSSTLHSELPPLEAATLAFVEDLYGGDLDPVLADSVGANIAALRSTTCFVVEPPNPELGEGPVFAAWEGSF